jgi:hypothetical protein
MNTCTTVINFFAYTKQAPEGRGFGRQTIRTFHCPTCKAERRLIVNGRRGKRPVMPPGAFVCGALLANPLARTSILSSHTRVGNAYEHHPEGSPARR